MTAVRGEKFPTTLTRHGVNTGGQNSQLQSAMQPATVIGRNKGTVLNRSEPGIVATHPTLSAGPTLQW